MAAALWRVRSVGEVGEGSAGAQMREGERACEALGSSDRGEVVASSTRDVGVESAAREDRGGGYAKTEELTARAHEQRERKAGADAGKAVALTGGPAEGAGEAGFFSFFFYSGICFLFSFYLLYLIQIQISHNFKLAFLRIMHQTKVEFRV
jgi:hypothetical protein